MKKEFIELINNNEEDKFYNSWTWRKKRLEILSRDNKECQVCKEEGRVGKGEVVHHIKHLKKYPSLGMTDDNLLTVCHNCHNLLHPEKFNNQKKDKFINEERW